MIHSYLVCVCVCVSKRGAAERRGQAGPGGSAQPKTRTPRKDVGKKDLSNKHWELK